MIPKYIKIAFYAIIAITALVMLNYQRMVWTSPQSICGCCEPTRKVQFNPVLENPKATRLTRTQSTVSLVVNANQPPQPDSERRTTSFVLATVPPTTPQELIPRDVESYCVSIRNGEPVYTAYSNIYPACPVQEERRNNTH